ncbi:kynurenine 3-monooxygenase [Phlebotomus argentipes]|uniref:kynurenine 3-monooxygenase n=1 Tax=Phlebotomus argentipes TaxID=94469 RepID=UPI0028933FA6|nr:kynurenine 3-monooxygenase [Phlebotomus argentipes]
MQQYPETFTNNIRENPDVSIVGGGLVGSLLALHLGKKGYQVHLYEFRDDVRTTELIGGRSINLALSVRGRKALAAVGLEDVILKHAIPMRGRMIHDLNGKRRIVPYDKTKNQCIYSVGRKYLNEVLLNASERYPNIHLNFNHKLMDMRVEETQMTFKNPKTDEVKEVATDMIIGCDGAFSAVRRHMISRPGFDFSQTYIEHGYLELCIPPTASGDFAMPHNFLHIWPRGKFMMIALPNQDKSWTVTLFMPFENFDMLQTPKDLLDFFGTHFADSIQLIGKERLIKDFFKIKPQTLVMIKCRPYHISNNVLLMGDAAHAMVPFYGQGMNAGFEDCSILSEILDRSPNMDFYSAIREFSAKRWEDAFAICDLAMYNYVEMRDLVNRRSYLWRKKLDDFLFWFMPNTWMPLYNTVSFSHMPYRKCIENREWQNRVLNWSMVSLAGAGLAAVASGVAKAVWYP